MEREVSKVTKFQIRNGGFGHTLVEAETAKEALLTFLVNRATFHYQENIQERDDGTAAVTLTDVISGVPTESSYYAVSLDAVRKAAGLESIVTQINTGLINDEECARMLDQLGATDEELEAAVARSGG